MIVLYEHYNHLDYFSSFHDKVECSSFYKKINLSTSTVKSYVQTNDILL